MGSGGRSGSFKVQEGLVEQVGLAIFSLNMNHLDLNR